MANASVAVDGNGNAIAVWTRTEGAVTTVWGNLYLVGTGWTATPQPISSGANSASAPYVAVNAAGVAIAVWREANKIWARRYTIPTNSLDSTISDLGEADANAASPDEAPKPKVAIDASGNALVVWHEYGSNGIANVNSIWANRYSGVVWSGNVLIETGAGNALHPQIAMDGAGNAIAVWQQDGAAGDEEIRASRFTGAGGWVPAPNPLDHPTNTEAGVPQIAMNANGDAILVWRELLASGGNVIYARRYTAGTWALNPVALSTVPGNNADAPQVTIDQSANGIAVWTQTIGAKIRVMASRYSSGTWAVAAAIDSNGFGDSAQPRIAMNAGGSAFVVWQSMDTTLPTEQIRSIWSNRLPVGGSWNPSTASTLENVGPDDASRPHVAVDATGRAIAVWQQVDGAVESIFSARFQ